MKIVICWSHISGYMAACWRALAAVPGVELFVLGFESDPVAPFDTRLLGEVRHRLLSETDRQNADLTKQLVVDEKPDVMLMSGWFHPAYRALAKDPAVAGVKKILAVDTPFRGDLRQAIGKHLLKSLLRKFDRIVVSGERGYAYARYLGFTEQQIRRGVY
ncbi:MAG: rfaG, partial [Phycisphaerales bacterium]|nr:rfaG [Phycisphaerales bacterium]